jgi:predicted transcriptional regulator
MEDMVMRSVYLDPSDDGRLRQLAHETGATKRDLVSAAVAIKLEEWLSSEGRDKVLRDLGAGRNSPALS